jgi:hypothetical protein
VDRKIALAFWSSIPLFLFFVLVSFGKSVKIHWTAPAFVGLLPLMAAGLERWTSPRRTMFLSSAGAMTVLTYLYLVYPYPLSVSLPNSWMPSAIKQKAADYVKTDWTAHLYGYAELGSFLKSKIADGESGGFDLIASARFDRASIAAFYAGYPERAFVPAYGDRRGYMLWPSRHAKPGADALYVDAGQSSVARHNREMRRLRSDYVAVGDPFQIEAFFKGHPFRRFLVYPCYGLKEEALIDLSDAVFQHAEREEDPPPIDTLSAKPGQLHAFLGSVQRGS